MFRDERQKHRALRALLASSAALSGFWTDNGPTDEAWRLREAGGGPLSQGERTLLLAACDIANDSTGLTFRDVLRLDPPRLAALCTLLVAQDRGAAAVDAWIALHEVPLPHCPECGAELPAEDRGRRCPGCDEIPGPRHGAEPQRGQA